MIGPNIFRDRRAHALLRARMINRQLAQYNTSYWVKHRGHYAYLVHELYTSLYIAQWLHTHKGPSQ